MCQALINGFCNYFLFSSLPHIYHFALLLFFLLSHSIQGGCGLLQAVRGKVGIAFCLADLPVAQVLLDRIERDAGHHKPAGTGMAEAVEHDLLPRVINVLVPAQVLDDFFKGIADLISFPAILGWEH